LNAIHLHRLASNSKIDSSNSKKSHYTASIKEKGEVDNGMVSYILGKTTSTLSIKDEIFKTSFISQVSFIGREFSTLFYTYTYALVISYILLHWPCLRLVSVDQPLLQRLSIYTYIHARTRIDDLYAYGKRLRSD
jgi:hypothetical protein